MADGSVFSLPPDTPINRLQAREAFDGLSPAERRYAHYLSRACWEAGLICLLQTSPESAPVFLLLEALFSAQTPADLRQAVGESVSDEEFQALLLYTCGVFCNLGNYKSFGDTKFIPGLSKERFHAVLQASALYSSDPERTERLWAACGDALFSLGPRERQLGLGDDGITTYYSSNCCRADVDAVQEFMKKKGIEPCNTRVFKVVKGNTTFLELRLASVATTDEPCCAADNVPVLLGEHVSGSVTIKVTRGDFSPLLARCIENLEKAKEYASNSHERAMLECYISSFLTGSVDAHKDGSRHWIKNKGPTVETYIGFIETYRDPCGMRAEYEGFVAVVNKAMSEKFARLVETAESLLSELPWPRAFEKDVFLRPDFTCLDVVTYASSGIPVGINIPNYAEICQNEGFKNLSLGNVLQSRAQDKRVSFLSKDDAELYKKLYSSSFEVQVGLHELLGHGSGKLLKQDEQGLFNFDIAAVRNPLTGEKISSWYGPGDSWDNKFTSVTNAYEECRAECVGLYLCLSPEALSIFGHEGSEAEPISYVNWLGMVRAGLMGLEFYTPETKKWRQAHMQARHVILRVLLEETEDLVRVEQTTGPDGQADLVVSLDRSKIETVGRAAIGEFLKKLQVYKSTGDAVGGTRLFERYCTVEDGGAWQWLTMREIVMARKLPRAMYVQPLTAIDTDGCVTLEEFESTTEGIIQFLVKCFQGNNNEALETLWEQDKDHWP